jgi:hypothetical protein
MQAKPRDFGAPNFWYLNKALRLRSPLRLLENINSTVVSIINSEAGEDRSGNRATPAVRATLCLVKQACFAEPLRIFHRPTRASITRPEKLRDLEPFPDKD